eukprot:1281843-Amorphochlora_amoeboformis.AAC.1
MEYIHLHTTLPSLRTQQELDTTHASDKSVKLLLSAGADPTLPPEAPALETALSHYRSTYVIKQML